MLVYYIISSLYENNFVIILSASFTNAFIRKNIQMKILDTRSWSQVNEYGVTIVQKSNFKVKMEQNLIIKRHQWETPSEQFRMQIGRGTICSCKHWCYDILNCTVFSWPTRCYSNSCSSGKWQVFVLTQMRELKFWWKFKSAKWIHFDYKLYAVPLSLVLNF